MTFRNAFKILLSAFKYVWSVLSYLVLVGLLVGSLSFPLLKSVGNELAVAGVFEIIGDALYGFLNGQPLGVTFEIIGGAFNEAKNVFIADGSALLTSTVISAIVIVAAYRFLSGLYEIPALKVLEGVMSDNARYGYAGTFVGSLNKSVRFSALKTLVSACLTAAELLLVSFPIRLLSSVSVVLVPVAFSSFMVVLKTLEYTFLAAWGARSVTGGDGVVRSLGYSIRFGAKHFAPMASTYCVAWIVLVTVNIFVGAFTFLIGLAITVPASALFVDVLNMTFYYSRNDVSYYLDGEVVLQNHSEKNAN